VSDVCVGSCLLLCCVCELFVECVFGMILWDLSSNILFDFLV